MSTKLKTIPLCQLRRSASNVRKTDRRAGIKQLAKNIEANGLLENLLVRPIAETGAGHTHEVTAGGRRLAALQLLAKREKIERDYPVPCLVRGAEDGDATEVSLSENFMREDVHPADQFEAFAKRIGQGASPEEIGARFGVTPTFVHQRLKLAAVSPRLIAEYRDGAMTLEQLTAFTLSDDHQSQEAIWFDRPYAEMPARTIRRLLTQTQVEGMDRRARFIGARAYEKAGGVIVRDLFDTEDEGYLSDSQLLDRLVAEKLTVAAEPIRAEGWQWVEIRTDAELSTFGRFGRANSVEQPLGEAEEARLLELNSRYDELITALEEEEDTSAVAELDRVLAEIETFHARRESWPDEEKARAGVVVSVASDGSLSIQRGLLRLEELDREMPAERPKKRDRANAYSESVLKDLAAHRTAALREAVAARPDIALRALLFTLVCRLFDSQRSTGSLDIVAIQASLEQSSPTVEESRAVQAFRSRHDIWRERLPETEGLWQWLATLDDSEQLSLLAHCVGMTVNALIGGHNDRSADSDLLAQAVELDMRAWWQPTQATLLDRLTKEEILAAVADGASPEAARRLSGAKKDAMAKAAETLLVQSRWLPAPLRAESPTVENASTQ
jgi:ParB family chromosome partitioning protein